MSAPPRHLAALCLTGGGVMVRYTTSVLEQLQGMRDVAVGSVAGVEPRLAYAFDLLAGTSAGALVVAGLAVGQSPAALSQLLDDHAERIFPRWRRITRGLRPYQAMYRREPLEEAVAAALGQDINVTLGDLSVPVVIPTFNETTGEPVVFCSLTERHKSKRLRDVVLASAAAPIYFPAHILDGHRYVDGGLFANAPDMAAFSILRRTWPTVAPLDIDLISVGVGRTNAASPRTMTDLGNWGYLDWMTRPIPRLLNVTLRAQADSLTGQLPSLGLRSFTRINTSVQSSAQPELDRADPVTLRALADAGACALDNLDQNLLRRVVSRHRAAA